MGGWSSALAGEQDRGTESCYWTIAPFLVMDNQGLTWISNCKTERRGGI